MWEIAATIEEQTHNVIDVPIQTLSEFIELTIISMIKYLACMQYEYVNESIFYPESH